MLGSTRGVGVAGCCIAMGFAFGGCNVDGRWNQLGAPAGPAVRVHHAPAEFASGIGEAQEVDLVESMTSHRSRYRDDLQKLHALYRSKGYATKAGWAGFELKGLGKVKQFRYLRESEVPTQTLKPSEKIPAADAMFDRGYNLMRQGGHGVPMLFHEGRMVKAAEVFRELIDQHPTSDKVDDAAFFLGEIHKEYLSGQEQIALDWYERAWLWNPNTPHPARFQAAVVCDYRLHDRDRALELYQGVVQHETDIASNVRWATRRIYELTQPGKTVQAAILR